MELAAGHPPRLPCSPRSKTGIRWWRRWAAWAAGERPTDPQLDAVVGRLVAQAGTHPDPLVREAAIAALGSLEAPAGRAAILAGMQDKPNVRRRAVLALVVHEGPDIDAALRRAASDRDWQVRTAAEELLRITDESG
ncbi:MAG: HEAT repeat domain-containing protein [Acidimicrobiales bacterium]